MSHDGKKINLAVLVLLITPQLLHAYVTIDQFGVERSSEPFTRRPSLYLNVTYDLYDRDPFMDPSVTAEQMLDVDMETNVKLNITWALAKEQRPDYNSTELAAYAYSMQEPEFMYADFNTKTSAFRDSSDYATEYDYKGFFGLLQLASRAHDDVQLYYRGVSYTQEALVGEYIRFNRFLSCSTSFDISQNFTGQSGGSLFVILPGPPGAATANHIAPYSLKPEEEEYLMTQDVQFLVTWVQSGFQLPNGHFATLINMTVVPYVA